MATPYSRGGHPAAREPHAALCLASCGSYTHLEVCVSYMCLLHLSSIRCFLVRGKEGVDAHVSL